MKKQILNIGKGLSKAEQRNINGGCGHCSSGEDPEFCESNTECPVGMGCCNYDANGQGECLVNC